jgi:hypothetical protein
VRARVIVYAVIAPVPPAPMCVHSQADLTPGLEIDMVATIISNLVRAPRRESVNLVG